MSDNLGTGEGSDIADAIAQFILENTDSEIMPMVGGFTLIAEMIDPTTGMQGLFTLRDDTIPVWTEYGMLASRMAELSAEMQMGAMGEVYEEWEDE
jgi:hypothetical protein